MTLYLGVGDRGGLPTSKNNKKIKSFCVWASMLERCYSGYPLKKYPSYKGCTVCDEWLYYPNFLKWFSVNYKKGFHLDKDLKNRGAKIYRPENCSFVPCEINNLTLNTKSLRGDLPVGVVFHKGSGLFMSRVHCGGSSNTALYFKDKNSAFESYKERKTMHIIKTANEHYAMGNICSQVFDTLIKWEIKNDD